MSNIIDRFYSAFQELDGDQMASCYHEDIEFHDPAFGRLNGIHAKNMWRMLCDSQKGKDFRIVFSDVHLKNEKGSAHWEAFYTFSKTNRKVHNKIDAEFLIKDGKIINHIDRFNLQNWAKQAFGLKGALLGGTHFFQRKLQKQTNEMLKRYENNLK